MAPRTCAAANCEGTEHVYSWPSNPVLSSRWTAFVKDKVANFSKNSRSVLCFRHFTEDMFVNYGQYKLLKNEKIR